MKTRIGMFLAAAMAAACAQADTWAGPDAESSYECHTTIRYVQCFSKVLSCDEYVLMSYI